jgi:hypothetical protein
MRNLWFTIKTKLHQIWCDFMNEHDYESIYDSCGLVGDECRKCGKYKPYR